MVVINSSQKIKYNEDSSYCRRRDHLLEIMKRTRWDEEDEKPRRTRRVVKYIKIK